MSTNTIDGAQSPASILHNMTEAERLDQFTEWIADGCDPLDLPAPSTWPEFDAKWAKAWRTREAVLTSRDHWDRYHSDLLHVGLVTGTFHRTEGL